MLKPKHHIVGNTIILPKFFRWKARFYNEWIYSASPKTKNPDLPAPASQNKNENQSLTKKAAHFYKDELNGYFTNYKLVSVQAFHT